MDKKGYIRDAATKFNAEEREAIWEVISTRFEFEGQDELDLCRQLWEERDSLPREHAGVYVDEVQDLCEVEWMLLAQMVRHSGGLFFTGDPYQALRPSGFYWKRLQLRLGRNLQVQEGSLSLNLRNTRQIAEFVQGELERIRAKYHMEQQPDYRVTALIEGLPPALGHIRRIDASQVARWLGDQGALVVWDPSARSEPFAQAVLEAGGLVVTVDEAKGLEFDWTAVLKPYTSLAHQMEGRSSLVRAQAFSRLYVALTRARRGLLVLDEQTDLSPSVLPQADSAWWQSWEAAEHVLVRSVQAVVESGRSRSAGTAWWKAVARVAESLGDLDRAIEYYERAGLYGDLARCTEKLGRFSDAEAYYETAEQFSEAARCYERAGGYMEAARCYEQAGEYADAASCYEKAGRYAEAGRCYRWSGRYADAVRCERLSRSRGGR